MQWTFPWVSSFKNGFNYDYHVTLDPDKDSPVYNYRKVDFRGEMPGLSVFFRDNDLILHSYSTYLRGLDMLCRCTTSSTGLRWVVRRKTGPAWRTAKTPGFSSTTRMALKATGNCKPNPRVAKTKHAASGSDGSV
jgi:hypothetical protein